MDDIDTTKQSPITRPVVTLSYAQTLDGRLATSTGSSRWISAPESLHFSHELRATHDAIMVGVDLDLESRIEYPGSPPPTIESEERIGCVTA